MPLKFHIGTQMTFKWTKISAWQDSFVISYLSENKMMNVDTLSYFWLMLVLLSLLKPLKALTV